jgi:high-affinity Fe2+/Pb2+ permease
MTERQKEVWSGVLLMVLLGGLLLGGLWVLRLTGN